jgi:glycosyltransferase involved in cell wall biosynthesis
MKITFVMPFYSPTPIGGFKVTYEYANQLAARGHDIVVVHPLSLPNASPYPQLVSKLRDRLRGAFSRTPSLILIPEVPWHVMDHRVKLISVPDPSSPHVPDADAVIASFYLNVEYLVHYPHSKGKKFYLVDAFEGSVGPLERDLKAWREPIKKILISRALYEHAVELGIPADELVCIPNGIDHVKYRVLRPIEERKAQVAMLYHILPIKGMEDGICALQLVRQRFPNLHAVLFGVFPRPEELPSWIDYCQDPPQDELVGSIYNGSSIFLSSSWAEGFMLPLAEAMACGCAAVSTDSGGVRDFAEDGVTALLSPPKNPAALANNILNLLENDDLRIRLAKAGHKRIGEFTWEKSADSLERVLGNRDSLKALSE